MYKSKIKIFADGASINEMLELHKMPHIRGFTTNPTLMKKAGVPNYENFAKELLSKIKDAPISFEVFADDDEGMYKQAKIISSWGKNVYVKIPVMNTQKKDSYALIEKLSDEGLKLNVTAIFTQNQIKEVTKALKNSPGGIVSIFAGRIADTGCDPMPIMKFASQLVKGSPNIETLWASPREVLNVVQAEEAGCDIITATNDILKKLSSFGKDLYDFSLDTVKMFYNDAKGAGYTIGSEKYEIKEKPLSKGPDDNFKKLENTSILN